MTKFVLPAHGEMERTPDSQQAHRSWWSSIQDHVVDPGNPSFNGRNVTRNGAVSELTAAESPALGYTIVQAESIDEAIAPLDGGPTDMWVYEAMPM